MWADIIVEMFRIRVHHSGMCRMAKVHNFGQILLDSTDFAMWCAGWTSRWPFDAAATDLLTNLQHVLIQFFLCGHFLIPFCWRTTLPRFKKATHARINVAMPGTIANYVPNRAGHCVERWSLRLGKPSIKLIRECLLVAVGEVRRAPHVLTCAAHSIDEVPHR